MKKNFLFKGVSVLGAVLLLATSVMPGLQTFATLDNQEWWEAEDLGTTLVYDLIYNEESWNAAYNKENSALKKYLDENWSEDAWNYKENRPCNWDDWDTPHVWDTATKFDEDSGCVQSWKGAFNAPEAQYPWVVINVPEGGIQGTISFGYDGKETVYPWLEHATLGKYGIASIPGEFSDASLMVNENGEGNFDVSNFSIKITPQRVRTLEKDSEWFYIYNEESWNNAYNNESSGLRKYEDSSRYEDLWSTKYERAAGITDMRCTFTSYADNEGDNEYTKGVIQAIKYGPWAGTNYTEVKVTENNDFEELVGSTFYLKNDIDIDDIGDDLYELFIDDTLGTSAGVWVRIESCSYPEFTKSWLGAFNSPDAKYPWIALGSTDGNPFYFKEAPKSFYIAFKYKHDKNTPTKIVHPRGRGVRENKSWGVADIPGEFETPAYKVDINGVATTQFNPDNLRVLVVENEGAEITIPMATYTVTYTDGIDGVYFANDEHNSLLPGSDTPAFAGTTTKEGYSFIAWDPEVATKVTADTTYTATWDCAAEYHKVPSGACDSNESTYTVTWENENGTELEKDTDVEYDTTPSYDGATPTKASDSNYTYTFKGWKKEGTEVTIANEKVISDVTYVATFTAKSKTSYSGGGGGSSKKTETKEDAKATTGDTAKVDDKKVDETKTDETKNDTDNEGSDGNKNPTTFSQEFIDAYNFAYKNGITTKESIEEADMFEPLTRIAMAKMLSQYAINVLGKTPDTTVVVPTFPDVDAKLDADYNNGVTLAYQLGIMGIGIQKFRPFDTVTRAEFGTALSRMLYGTADGEGNEWYSTHLQKLMDEKIITNNNPNLKELRGYVMIMLMRSAQ